jgi:NhaP-type Na+/H+ or K+/H+ antiporter
MLLAGGTPDYLVEITFTTLAAYGSFFVAEDYRCSGALAALTAGLVVGNFRSSGSISAAGRHGFGVVLGVRSVCSQFADLFADWRARREAAF